MHDDIKTILLTKEEIDALVLALKEISKDVAIEKTNLEHR